MPRGYDRPLYILPFDHRGSFQTKMFGWKSPLSDAQTAEIAGAKQVVYDGFLGGARRRRTSKDRPAFLSTNNSALRSCATLRQRALSPLVRRRKADRLNSTLNTARILRVTSKLSIRPSAKCWCVTTQSGDQRIE